MFERRHHQRVAQLLLALDGHLLRANNCLFGGGTVIALRYGEYRESVDIDFMVSDLTGYRNLRQISRQDENILPFVREGITPIVLDQPLRADQYGIRAHAAVSGAQIKFEVVLEGRIELEQPGADDTVCGIATLTPLDMAASKLLANSDRWLEASVFSRDVIDLAMMELPLPTLRQAVAKAKQAYGDAILADLEKAIVRLTEQNGLLDRSINAMAINVPKAVLWQNLHNLKRLL